MKKIINYPKNQLEFKIKKHWWMWVLGLLFNFFAISAAVRGYYFLLIIVLIADLIVIPDACHYKYVIDDKFLDVKGIGFPGPVIFLASITVVEEVAIMTFRGFGLKIFTDTVGGHMRIKYMEGRREKAVIISPKNRTGFLDALGSRVDKGVIIADRGFEFIQGKKSKPE